LASASATFLTVADTTTSWLALTGRVLSTYAFTVPPAVASAKTTAAAATP